MAQNMFDDCLFKLRENIRKKRNLDRAIGTLARQSAGDWGEAMGRRREGGIRWPRSGVTQHAEGGGCAGSGEGEKYAAIMR